MDDALRYWVDRGQTIVLPECLGDGGEQSNPVCAVDVSVEALDLAHLGIHTYAS
jgi:hypothetical protein